VVIVNYRTAKLAAACLRSLEPEVRTSTGIHVVMVDGGSADGSAEVLARTIEEQGYGSWVTFLPLDRNGGFAYANNQAIEPALREVGRRRPRFVYLLNPDTEVFPNAIRTLVEFMRDRPEIGIAGSRCENEDGTIRRTAFRFHSVLGELEREAGLGVVSKVLAPWVVAPPVQDRPHPTDWVSGAAMMVRTEVFEQIGLLDDRYFLYYEETDFARRSAEAGFECWYVPESRVVHYCGQSTGVTGASAVRRVPRYVYESRQRYFSKHHGLAYAAVANAAWMVGACVPLIRQGVRRKEPSSRSFQRYTDFVHHNFALWTTR